MPLSVVDRFFQQFLSVIDGKNIPVCRRTLTSKVENIAEDTRMWLKKTQLSKTDHVSVTVNIWSDRKMRGFLGVTVHYIERQDQGGMQLRSNLQILEATPEQKKIVHFSFS